MDKRIATVNYMKAKLAAVFTLEEADSLWEDWVGYSMLDEAPDTPYEEIRQTLEDYILETGHSLGVHRELCEDFSGYTNEELEYFIAEFEENTKGRVL